MPRCPWVDSYLQTCAQADTGPWSFNCVDLCNFSVITGTCIQCDKCCRGLNFFQMFNNACIFYPPGTQFRFRFGFYSPPGFGLYGYWFEVKTPGSSIWSVEAGTQCDSPPWGNFCSVEYTDNYRCSPSECCFCEGCGDVANCQDLIDKLEEMRIGINCLSQRIDCLNEIYGQSQCSREYLANHYANLERILVNNSTQMSQALLAVGWAISKQEVPFPTLPAEPTSDPTENAELGCTTVGTAWCDIIPPPA